MVRRWGVRALTSVVAAVFPVVFVAGAAAAKGASSATITGPGIESPLRLECCQTSTSDGESTPMLVGNPNELAEATGMVSAAFRVWPTTIVGERPVGRLGPRYRVTFDFLTGVDQVTPLRQDVYPFARAGFVSYTPPGQRLFEKKTRSGWYVSAPQPNGGGMTSGDAQALLASFGITRPVVRTGNRR